MTSSTLERERDKTAGAAPISGPLETRLEPGSARQPGASQRTQCLERWAVRTR